MMIPDSRPNKLQKLLQQIPASKAGAAVFSKILHFVDRPLMKASGGKLSLPGILAGVPVVTLTTTGAKSGKSRTVPLVALAIEGKIILIASNWGQQHHPAWYLNLRANPQATVSIGSTESMFIAHEADDAEREKYWERAYQIYFGFRLYRQRVKDRKIPIMVLEPVNNGQD